MTSKYKTIRVIDAIRKKFSGQWKYNRSLQQYERSDGTYIHRVLTGVDYNGEYDGTWCWYIYWADKTPERVYL